MVSKPPDSLLADRYVVGEVIGTGGMGEVRRGSDRRLGREVAIKFLRPDLADQPQVRSRFEHEARAAARLMHPAAVTVFDSGETSDGVPYLVMELLPGRSVADELRAGPIPEERVQRIALDVLGALGAAHTLGILHRDVKPANLLVTPDGGVKLADFGIAKSTDLADQTVTGQLVGTVAYLAPERLRGRDATPSSDLYSLGVVLFEALTGTKPFDGDTPMSVAYAIDNTAAPRVRDRLPSVDRLLDETIHRALTKEPADRFPTAEDMAAALTDQTRPTITQTTLAPPPDPTTVFPVAPHEAIADRVRRWWQQQGPRRRTLYAGGGAAILALLILFAIGNNRTGSHPSSPTTVAPTTAASLNPPPPGLDQAIRNLENEVQR